MFKFALMTIIFLSIACPAAWAQQNQVTLTSFYPSPAGEYTKLTSDQIKLRPKTQAEIDAVNACNVAANEGMLYYNSANNQLQLCNDAAGPLSWSPIAGTWTLGLDATTNPATPLLFPTNGNTTRVGIGKINPKVMLDVTGSGSISGGLSVGVPINGVPGGPGLAVGGNDKFVVDSPSGRVLIPKGTLAALSLAFNGDTTTGLYSEVTNTLSLATGGVERVTILADGKVGIGNTNPQASLSVGPNFRVNSGGLVLLPSGARGAGTLALSFTGDTNTGLYSGGAATGILNLTTAGNDRVTVLANGSVGIGDTTPAALFTVGDTDLFQVTAAGITRLPNGSAATPALSFTGDTNNDTGLYRAGENTLTLATGGANRVTINNTDMTITDNVTINGNLTVTGFVASSGNNMYLPSGQYLYDPIPSDERLKKNIKPLAGALGKVRQLNGVSFQWKNNNVNDIGVIAQNVEKVLPELVTESADGMKNVKYANLVAVLIEAIKEQQKEIENLKHDLQALSQTRPDGIDIQ